MSVPDSFVVFHIVKKLLSIVLHIFLASVKKVWQTHKITKNAYKQYILVPLFPQNHDKPFPSHSKQWQQKKT